MIFNESINNNVSFALRCKANEDLFHKIKDIIVGGLSTVLKQFAKTVETHIIYSPEKLYQKIMGLNANTLHLWEKGQDMPAGVFIRKSSATGFKPEVRDKYVSSFLV